MSDFRENQNSAHPNKTNVLMSAIIVILLIILTLQIWLLHGALNNALENHNHFAWATFGASFFLFISALFLLKYLPDARKKKEINKENQYE